MYISSIMLRFLVFILFAVLNTSILLAEIVNDIKVRGNNRVSTETIIVFSDIKRGEDVSNKKLNSSLKELYNTNFFKDVSVEIVDDILSIKVIEAPIINKIEIKGIKAKKNLKLIEQNLIMKSRSSFNEFL